MNRKAWIDALRALAIILVVLGHLLKGDNVFYVFTSPVKMPLFFAISGYLFKMRDGSDIGFFRNLFKRLVVPWFCLALIVFLPQLFQGANIIEYIGELLSGEKYWFLPCFLIAEIIHYYVRKLSKNDIQIIILCLLLTILGIYLHHLSILDYAMFNRALSVQMFFLIGYIFHKSEGKMVKVPWKYIGLGGAMYILFAILSLYLYPNSSLDVHVCRYYSYPYCFILIYLGCFILFTAAAKSSYNNKLLNIIGQNTLVIYMWHGYVIGKFKMLMDICGLYFGNIWFDGLIKLLWALLVCNSLAFFVNKYLPEIVGKKRLNKNQ